MSSCTNHELMRANHKRMSHCCMGPPRRCDNLVPMDRPLGTSDPYVRFKLNGEVKASRCCCCCCWLVVASLSLVLQLSTTGCSCCGTFGRELPLVLPAAAACCCCLLLLPDAAACLLLPVAAA